MRPEADLGYNPKGLLLVIYIHHLGPKSPSFHTLPNQQRKLKIQGLNTGSYGECFIFHLSYSVAFNMRGYQIS